MLSIQNGQKGRFWRFINKKTIEMAFFELYRRDTKASQRTQRKLCEPLRYLCVLCGLLFLSRLATAKSPTPNFA